MTETKKTLRILINRWPEVFLIVGFFTLGNRSMIILNSKETDFTNILTMLFVLSLIVISMILNFGFLRTVHLEGSKKHTPRDLLKTGKHFFWRIFGFSIIYGILYFILKTIIFVILRNITSIDTGFWELAKSNPVLFTLNISLTMIILIKLTLFIPAIIIVLDCRVSDTLDFLNKCRLSEAKELVVLYFVSIALLFFWALLKISYFPETILQHILKTGTNIIHQVLSLIIAVTAVRFVGSLNLVYDRDTKDSNSEDLIETPKED